MVARATGQHRAVSAGLSRRPACVGDRSSQTRTVGSTRLRKGSRRVGRARLCLARDGDNAGGAADPGPKLFVTSLQAVVGGTALATVVSQAEPILLEPIALWITSETSQLATKIPITR